MSNLLSRNGPHQIDATYLGEKYRLEVLAVLLDGVAKQDQAGVWLQPARKIALTSVVYKLPGPEDSAFI